MRNEKISEKACIARNAVVIGNVTIGTESSIWYQSTVRAEEAEIRIGCGSNIQDNCVIHVDPGFDVDIADHVTVGHGVILHGCSIGENSLIGMGSTVLNGAKIGKNCIIGAGSLVTGGTVIPDNSMAFGNPAKVRRMLRPEEVEANAAAAAHYIKESAELEKENWYL